MTRDDLARWLERYVECWRSYDAATIGDLFSEDAEYRYHPYDAEPVHGREQIVADWLDPEARDEPGTWEASYEPFAVDGDHAVAVGWSRYLATDDAPERLYHNTFLLEFDADGRCRRFTDFYMQRPEPGAGEGDGGGDG
jgi:ketosteroid isomerase-like protein